MVCARSRVDWNKIQDKGFIIYKWVFQNKIQGKHIQAVAN